MRQAGIQSAVLALNVHKHKACGVPKFIAEVAVAFSAAQVKVDVAAKRGVGGHGETQGIGAVRGNAVGIIFAKFLFNLRSLFRLTQAARVFLHQAFEINAVHDVERVKRVAFALRHLLAFSVTHQAVQVNTLEGDSAREVTSHHHHTGNPEEDDVIARHEHGAR